MGMGFVRSITVDDPFEIIITVSVGQDPEVKRIETAFCRQRHV